MAIPFTNEAPSGAVGPDDALYLAWWYTDTVTVGCPAWPDCGPCSTPDEIRIKRIPLVGGLPAPPAAYTVIPPPGQAFHGYQANTYAGDGLMANSAPAVAVDSSFGPYHGRMYIAYIDVVDRTRIRCDPLDPTITGNLVRATRVKVARLRPDSGSVSGVSFVSGGSMPIVEVSPFNSCADEPACITEPGGYRPSIQTLTWIGVDGKGNVGVAWYDTRYDADFPHPRTAAYAKYDVLFSFSSDGGDTRCKPMRVTPPHPSLTLPSPNDDIHQPWSTSGLWSSVDDYGQICADPRPGRAGFLAATMENRRTFSAPCTAIDQSIYAYNIDLRVHGDFNPDYSPAS